MSKFIEVLKSKWEKSISKKKNVLQITSAGKVVKKTSRASQTMQASTSTLTDITIESELVKSFNFETPRQEYSKSSVNDSLSLNNDKITSNHLPAKEIQMNTVNSQMYYIPQQQQLSQVYSVAAPSASMKIPATQNSAGPRNPPHGLVSTNPRVLTSNRKCCFGGKQSKCFFILQVFLSFACFIGILYLHLKPQCGKDTNSNTTQRITFQPFMSASHFKQPNYPFIVKYFNKGDKKPCLATIINEAWLILPSECVRVNVFNNSLSGKVKTFDGKEFQVVQTFFSGDDYSNIQRMALIRVKENFVFNDKLWPAKIVPIDIEINKGFKARAFSLVAKQKLYSEMVRVYRYEVCDAMKKVGFKMKNRFEHLDYFDLCAGDVHGIKVNCVADGKGPLIYNETYLLGVFKRQGEKCGQAIIPNTYLSVMAESNWIQSTVSKFTYEMMENQILNN